MAEVEVDAVAEAAAGVALVVGATGAALAEVAGVVEAGVVEGATAVLGAPEAPEASDFSPAGAALPPRKAVTYQPEPLS